MKEKLGNYIKEISVRNKLNEDIPVYSVTNTEGFCKNFFNKDVTSNNKSNYKIVPKGYFAYNPSRINVGSIDWLRNEDKVLVSPLYNVFYVSEELNKQYLYYYLKSDIARQQIKFYATGSVRDNLKLSALYEFRLNIPSIEKQKSIINKLNKIVSLIELKQKQLTKLDELVKARFVEMFGDPLSGKYKTDYIKNIGKIISGATPKTNVDKYWDGNIKWITPAEIDDNTFFINDSIRHITKEGYDSCGTVIMPVGTVILSSRAPIGKVAILSEKMCCNQGFKNIIPNERINSIYLYWVLKQSNQYLNSLGRGATFKEISKQIVENIKITIPPINLQNKFADFVKQVDKSKFIFEPTLFINFPML
ncbi:MAG: restriction endonuclease subunit S [Erysipelotrichaceae bacterium]|nr:restriction endonuclease subunit S [Erysipelotrichaceae bacterium]